MHRSLKLMQRRVRHVSAEAAPAAFEGNRSPYFSTLPQNPGFDDRARELSEKVKSMSDTEWEHLPNDEKSIFVRFTRNQLQTSPADVTEQQRRRYYETTQHRVQLSPNMITNPYQRMKASLPFSMDTHGRRITVSEAMMESADAANFEPHQAKNIEYAQIHFKQVFKDYIEKRRAGVSTEAERRKIASMSESLHHMVQSHLANMYKYADHRLHEAVRQRAKDRLTSLESTKQTILNFMGSSDGSVQYPKRKSKASSAAKFGIDTQTHKVISERLREQEAFLEKLEVLNRLTSKSGFTHSEADEKLDEYTDRLASLLSLDAGLVSQMDAVQYFAKLDACEPIDWAKRWYEQNLLYPLEALPEYGKLKSIVDLDHSDSKGSATQSAAKKRFDAVTNFTALLFSGKEAPSLQMRRMRHLAFSFMQSQINRMRAKAVKYASVDMDAERAVVTDRLEKISELGGDLANKEVCALHAEIQACVQKVIDRCHAQFKSDSQVSGSTSRTTKERIVDAIHQKDPKALKTEVDRLRMQKSAERTLQLIRTLEDDVKADYKWCSLFEEAERPQQLPVPLPSVYVSASAARQLRDIKQSDDVLKGNPFEQSKQSWRVSLFGTSVALPTEPILFWGTGVRTVHQALAHAAETARQRSAPHGSSDGEGGAVGSDAQVAVSEKREERNPWAWRLNPQGIDALP